MNERRYCYLARAPLDLIDEEKPTIVDGDGVFAGQPVELTEDQWRRGKETRILSTPWWPEAIKDVHEDGYERIATPRIYTSQEAAEEKLIELLTGDDSFELVERYGERYLASKVSSDLALLGVFGLDEDLLVLKLEDSDFLCIRVDGVLKLRQDFLEELTEGRDE